jgi:hypothetical protein
MLRIKKLAGALTALGLVISTAPAGAFWSFGGGGIGGDNMWSPLDPRFEVIEGSMDFIETEVLESEGNFSRVRGNVEITMQLRGLAYNTEGRQALNLVNDGTEFGIFNFSMTYTNAVLITDVLEGRTEYDLDVRFDNGNDGFVGSGTGVLEYVTKTLDIGDLQDGVSDLVTNTGALLPGFDANGDPVDDVQQDSNGNWSIDEEAARQEGPDGEIPGDKIVFRTPECNALATGSDGSVECPGSFFSWTGFADDDEQPAATPDGAGDNFTIPGIGGTFATILDETFSTNQVLALIHGGSPCVGTPHVGDDIACNPVRRLFASDEAYYLQIRTTPAGIGVDATFVPVPAGLALISIGLVGLGAARQRGKAPNAR